MLGRNHILTRHCCQHTEHGSFEFWLQTIWYYLSQKALGDIFAHFLIPLFGISIRASLIYEKLAT